VPTVIAAPAGPVESVIGVTVPWVKFATYAFVPSGVIAIASGLPVAIVALVALVAVLIGVSVPDP
jgi:hypothetical protein